MKTLLTSGLLLCGFALFSQGTSQKGKRNDMEKEKIIQTITNIFSGSDERNWQKVEASMAEQVLLDYTSMAGGNPVSLSPRQITDSWKTILPGFGSTHHQIGNFTMDVQASKATAHFHGLALHYLPNESGDDYWVVIGTYEYALSKNGEGNWRADKINLTCKNKGAIYSFRPLHKRG
jgi:hypothetical protein